MKSCGPYLNILSNSTGRRVLRLRGAWAPRHPQGQHTDTNPNETNMMDQTRSDTSNASLEVTRGSATAPHTRLVSQRGEAGASQRRGSIIIETTTREEESVQRHAVGLDERDHASAVHDLARQVQVPQALEPGRVRQHAQRVRRDGVTSTSGQASEVHLGHRGSDDVQLVGTDGATAKLQ